MTNPSTELLKDTPPQGTTAERPQGATGPAEDNLKLPEGCIPILPVRSAVLFPATVLPLDAAAPKAAAAVQFAVRTQNPIGVLLQSDPEAETPGATQLAEVGTVAQVLRYIAAPDGRNHLICRGEQRFRIVEFVEGFPFLVARIERIAEPQATGPDVEARVLKLKERALEALRLIPAAPEGLRAAVAGISEPGQLADVLASFMDIKVSEKQRILEAVDVVARLDQVLWFVSYRLEVLRLSRDIGERTRQTIEGRQREHILREQLNTIQKEWGEGEEGGSDVSGLAEAIAKAGMPADVEATALKELKRLKRMPENAAEYSMLHSYLEWLSELPWQAGEGAAIGIAGARQGLH